MVQREQEKQSKLSQAKPRCKGGFCSFQGLLGSRNKRFREGQYSTAWIPGVWWHLYIQYQCRKGHVARRLEHGSLISFDSGYRVVPCSNNVHSFQQHCVARLQCRGRRYIGPGQSIPLQPSTLQILLFIPRPLLLNHRASLLPTPEMLSLMKLAALCAVAGLAFAQEQPCLNAYLFQDILTVCLYHSPLDIANCPVEYSADPDNGVNNYCQCADGS
nr:hypothetical protein CFP56_25955 [Quercus suber]